MGAGATTIVALSSGALPAGVAVVRVSGPQTRGLLQRFAGGVPPARSMALRSFSDGIDVLDRGLVVYFPAPFSFTGEDCAEFHLHGSAAVVRGFLRSLTALQDVVLAEPGAFTRRAIDNGKLDLVEVEGLGDLLVAETEHQRDLALSRLSGGLSEQFDEWRLTMLDLRASVEALLDFSDEDDVGLDLPPEWSGDVQVLIDAIGVALTGARQGRIIRTGFRVAIAGPPNVGKSSLINVLSKSEVAIVSAEAGTTRDVREVPMDLDGNLVVLLDLAGLRETDSLAEAEGIRRAKAEMTDADLVLWLVAPDADDVQMDNETTPPVWRVGTKSDVGVLSDVVHSVSAKTGDGISGLLQALAAEVSDIQSSGKSILISRERDITALSSARNALIELRSESIPLELVAEKLRYAADCLARLLGKMDNEAVLDRLFAHFCIGK